jgi:hypothetical protein
MLFKELKKEEKASLKASKVKNGVFSRKQLENSTENVQSKLYIYLYIVLYTFLVLARISNIGTVPKDFSLQVLSIFRQTAPLYSRRASLDKF